MKSAKRVSDGPWGRMAGLCTGFAITLIGSFNYMDPHVILFRALVGGLVVGITVSFCCGLLRITGTPR